MVLPVKYLIGVSGGTPFETGVTQHVYVNIEALSAVSGYENDSITYTAIIIDTDTNPMPATFVADLKINNVTVIANQAFDATVYDQETRELTLVFIVPGNVGNFVVKLVWAEQFI